MARQIGYGALTVTDVTDGINNATVYLYHRYASVTGHTPPANNKLTYNFKTGKITGATADFNGWTQTIPNGTDPLYVVTAVATSTENTYLIPSWSDETRLVVNGEDGKDGVDGTSITAVKEVYYFTTGTAPAPSTLKNGTAITSTSTGSNVWTTVVPAYSAGGHYYTSLQTSLSKGTSPVFSAISLNQALTDANNNAAIAKSIAQANEENAQGALAISQGLESRLKYIWVNLNESSSLPSDDTLITNDNYYLAGTYAASGIDGTTFSYSKTTTYGWNSLLRHTKLMFRYNGIALTTIGTDGLKLFAPVVSNGVVTGHKLGTEVTATEMNIYNPASQKVGMKLNSSGLTLYKYNSTTAAATLNGTGLNIAAGSIKLGSNFEATSDGVITAKSGTVGNLHITASSLYTGTHSAYNSAVAGIFIDDTYVSFGNGAVTYFKNDGSAKIGNWHFNTAGTQYADSAAISSSVTKQGRVYLAPSAVNTTNVAIGIGTRTDSSANYSWPCYMRGDGYFYASNANIGGTITAKAGSIGGFHITSSANTGTSAQGGHVYTNSFYRHSGDGTTYEYEVGMKGDATENPSSANTQTGNLAFYIKRIAKGANWSTATNIFYITHAGTIYASSADITGKITANNGYIGGTSGWTIASQQLYNGTIGADNSLHLGTKNLGSNTSIAGRAGSDWRFTVGSKFGVTNTGVVYATEAHISGAITATSLTLGTNASIAAGKVTGLSKVATSGKYTDLSSTPDLTVYIAKDGTVGSTPASGANGFKVSSAGILTASNAVIYGTIYATAGTIGGCSISSGVLKVKEANIDGKLTATKLSITTLDAIAANMGTLTSGTIKYGTVGSNNSFYLSNSDISVKIGGQTSNISGLRLTVGSGFGVTSAGKLYATGAVISGALTATSLTIDGTNYASDVKTISTKATKTAVEAAQSTADTAKADAASAATKATNYITVSGDGILVRRSTSDNTNGVKINSDGVRIYRNADNHTNITASGMQIYQGGSEVASFGSTARIGKPTTSNTGNVYIDDNNIYIRKGGTTLSQFTASGASLGANSDTAVINLCGSKGSISGSYSDQDYSLYIKNNYALPKTDSEKMIYIINDVSKGIANRVVLENTNSYARAAMQAGSHSVTVVSDEVGVSIKGDTYVVGQITSSSTLTAGATLYSTKNTMCVTDDTQYCGNSNHRWKAVYATDRTINTSDRKEKDILGTIPYAKDLIMSLEPIRYMWKNGDHRRTRMGFVAQDVSDVCKRLNQNLAFVYASYGNEGEDNEVPYYGEDVDDKLLHWGLSYEQLIAPMVQVIQDQQKEIEQLKKDIAEFKK